MNVNYYNKLVFELQNRDIDAMLISPSPELKFIMGETPDLCERFQGLFIKSSGENFYICNLLTADEVREYLGHEATIYKWFDGDDYLDAVKQALSDYGLLGKKIAVNSTAQICNILEIADRLNVSFIPGKEILEEIRIIKTDEEMDNLKRSSRIADLAMEDILNYIRPGMTEEQIKNLFPKLFRKYGGEFSSGVIAGGANTSYPHYNDNRYMLRDKDILLLDFGGYYEGMRSDITRTVFIGSVTDEQKGIYEIVRQSNEAGEKAAVKGAFIPDVDNAARNIIDSMGYGQFFTTRLGHGIGYMGHEMPDIKQSNERYLEEGMVFSVEPGIYLAGNFGVRIEDIVGITKYGTEIFNKVTKDIIVL